MVIGSGRRISCRKHYCAPGCTRRRSRSAQHDRGYSQWHVTLLLMRTGQEKHAPRKLGKAHSTSSPYQMRPIACSNRGLLRMHSPRSGPITGRFCWRRITGAGRWPRLPSCSVSRQALGVYVLGAIDPAERAQVDEHLATCPACREELASLAGLPAMLRKVPIVEAERLAAAEEDPELTGMPSPEMLTSLVSRTANVRRIHRWRGVLAAAAAVIVALGGGAAIATALQPGSHVVNEHWRTVQGSGAQGIHLTVRYRPVESGTMFETNVTGLWQGAKCNS